MNYAGIAKKNIDKGPPIFHPWSDDARIERLAVQAFDQLWHTLKIGDYASVQQLHGSMNSNKSLREYAGKNPFKVETFIRLRPHLYQTKVVVRGSTSILISRRSSQFRSALSILVAYIQWKGLLSMGEIRRFLLERGYRNVIDQLWHECTPSKAVCVRCATPFTADMGALFEWANYENRLVRTKAGVVDDVILIDWDDRFFNAKLVDKRVGDKRTITGVAVVTQLCKDEGRLCHYRAANADIVIEFSAEACGLSVDVDLRDYFRIGQRDVAYEARLTIDFRLRQNKYDVYRSWRAVSVRKHSGNGDDAKAISNVRLTSSDDWMKLLESELEYEDEKTGSASPTSSIISGNNYWHDDLTGSDSDD